MKSAKDEADILYFFSKTLLSKNFDQLKPTPKFHHEVWEYCCSEDERVAIAAPRNHAKSSAVTHVYTLYSVLFRHNDHVLLISNTENQAVAFLNDIKMELSENEELIKSFGPFIWLKDSEKEIIIESAKDKSKFRIIAKGAETSLRGLKWRHKRPNLIIVDDIEDDESVMNEDRRDKRKRWVESALIPSMSDGGKIRVVGTILHFDSLLEGMMPPLTGEGSEFTIEDGLSIKSTDLKRNWKSIKYRAHTDFDDFTEILWPERFSEERLKKARQGYIEQNMPEGYSQEYLNNPVSSAHAFFRQDDMPSMSDYEKSLNESRQFNYYAAIDPAVSTRERRSYTAIVIGGMDELGMLHIVEVVRERMDSKEIVDWMFALQIKYRLDLFIFEKGVIEKSIGPFLQDEMAKPERPFINLLAKPPVVDKKSRAASIRGRMRQGGVKFDTSADWWPTFQEEMLRFPRGAHDDQVDALAWIGLTLNELVPGQTKKEIEDEEYDNEFFDENFEGEGRSSITGY